MQFLYTTLFFLSLPLILLRLYWRGFKAPEYRLRWLERLGFYQQSSQKEVIWFHAVSVGEAEAVFPLIKQFMLKYPLAKILITTTTPTGSARVKAVMGQSVEHVYLPYDVSFAVQRFLNHFQPKIAVIMETEIWLNLFLLTAKAKIPLFIINARLSEKSCRGYQKIPSLIQLALASVTTIATQTEIDTQRFKAIGAKENQLQTLGNIKFDLSISDDVIKKGKDLRQEQFSQRFVWIIASTHQDEEAMFLQLYPQLKKQIPELLLIFVPRHPERFNEVAKLVENHPLQLVKRSSEKNCDFKTDVYLADTMGELKMLYAAADVTFVGGSLFKHLGGHNVLEPAAQEIPVMFGGYMRHFKAIAEGLLNQHAAIQCSDSEEISAQLIKLYQQPEYRQQLALRGKSFVEINQGALTRVLQLLTTYFK